jgi:CAAX protease family protein
MRTRIVQDAPVPPPTVPPPPRGVRARVRRHRLVAFFALAFVLAWGWVPWRSFGAFSPLFAALLVIGVADGRAGYRLLLSRILRWRVGWRWYAVAAALPAGPIALAALANVGLGASLSLDQFGWGVPLIFAIAMVNPLEGPLGEEPGWRGVALPGLQVGRSPLAGTAVLALLVALWHVPLLRAPFDLRPVDLVTTFLVTFWYAWLFNRTGGSVLLTLVAHAVDTSIETNKLFPGAADQARLSWLWAIAVGLLVAGLLVFDRDAWRTAPSAATGLDPEVAR